MIDFLALLAVAILFEAITFGKMCPYVCRKYNIVRIVKEYTRKLNEKLID